MGDGHPSDRLHGLNRNRCLEIKAHEDLEDSEGDENPEGIHLIEGDITHDKRDQGAEIAKGPGKLHLVVVIAPKPHGRSCRRPWIAPERRGDIHLKAWFNSNMKISDPKVKGIFFNLRSVRLPPSSGQRSPDQESSRSNQPGIHRLQDFLKRPWRLLGRIRWR